MAGAPVVRLVGFLERGMESSDAGELITMDLRRRVALVAVGPIREELAGALLADGYDVRLVDGAEAVGALCREGNKPDLVLIEEQLGARSGRQVVLGLRASGETFGLPVAGVLTDVSVPTVLRWLRVGATDLWRYPWAKGIASRTRELIDECDRTQIQLGQMRSRLLAWAARAQLTGTVTLHGGTPFEGRATFRDGQLSAANFGSLEGEQALEQLMELDDAPTTWEEVATQPMARAAVKSGFRARVLVVEDDPALRALLLRQLGTAGYQVDGVGDGRAGLQAVRSKPYDIVVSDLDLPHLDGWGLLRELRGDLSTREVAVLLLSAHEGTVETLKAARAGARAYLKKSGRSRELLDALALLASPRGRVWDSLADRLETKVELRSVGPGWLLRALAELDCRGRLELEDALGRYEVTVAQGQLVDAVAQTGSLRSQGQAALQAVLSSRAEGSFRFRDDVQATAAQPWVFDAVDRAGEAMRLVAAQRLAEASQRPGQLYLNEELAALFSRVASVAELRVLDAVKSSPDDLEALARMVELPIEEVQPVLSELLRRGVLSTEP